MNCSQQMLFVIQGQIQLISVVYKGCAHYE